MISSKELVCALGTVGLFGIAISGFSDTDRAHSVRPAGPISMVVTNANAPHLRAEKEAASDTGETRILCKTLLRAAIADIGFSCRKVNAKLALHDF